MKKTEKDYEYLETSPEARAAGLRRISRPEFIDKIIGKSSPEVKKRITIYLDADIVEHFKSAATGKEGYQTLINRALRRSVQNESALPEHIKESLLKDEEFLQNLKSALAV